MRRRIGIRIRTRIRITMRMRIDTGVRIRIRIRVRIEREGEGERAQLVKCVTNGDSLGNWMLSIIFLVSYILNNKRK